MTFKLLDPVNDTQRVFAKLCEKGRPARTKVQLLLRESGKQLNVRAEGEVAEHFQAFPQANPWHICFAIGLSWGRLAKFELDFTEAAVRVLANWNAADLRTACSYHYERGPEPIEQSLGGAHRLFSTVPLPETLPDTLVRLSRAQERWLSPISHPSTRPKYINTWNATAMFMVALFAQPELGDQLRSPVVALPTGGPIDAALRLLHQTKFLAKGPAGTALNDGDFESGAVYENNALFESVLMGLDDWDLVDVHSALYLLGTRLPESDKWVDLAGFA